MGTVWTQDGAGMAQGVARLPGILKKLVGNGLWPGVILSDRGPGLLQSSTGHIAKAYAAALKEHGFKTHQGEDASWQPAGLAEAVAAWTRVYMQKHPFDRRGSLDVQEACLKKSLQECAKAANSKYDVAGLCGRFPNRWQENVDSKRERLKRYGGERNDKRCVRALVAAYYRKCTCARLD